MQEKEFIRRLIQKLNTGNRKTIFLNAIPGKYISRLDFLSSQTYRNKSKKNRFVRWKKKR